MCTLDLFRAMEQTVSTLHELIELAEKGVNVEAFSLKISPELSAIRIQVEGPSYNEAIPGEQLKTLWELQRNLYRIVAFARYNSFDKRTLSVEDRAQFEIKVTSSRGSWLGKVLMSDYWNSLFQILIGKMSGPEIGLTIGVGVLLLMGCLRYDSRKKKLIELKRQVEFQKEKNVEKSYQTIQNVVDLFNNSSCNMADIIVQQIQATIDSTVENTAGRSHCAEKIIVAGRVLNNKQIEDLKIRTKAVADTYELIEGHFTIMALDKSNPSAYSMRIKHVESAFEFLAKLVPDAVDGNGEKSLALVNEAFFGNTPLNIRLILGTKGNLVISASKVPLGFSHPVEEEAKGNCCWF